MGWINNVVRCWFQFIEIVVDNGLVWSDQEFVLRSSGFLVDQVGRNIGENLDLGYVGIFFLGNTVKGKLRYVC